MSPIKLSWCCWALIVFVLGACGVNESAEDGMWPVLAQSEGGYFRITVQPRSDGAVVGLNRYEIFVFDADEMPVMDAAIRLELWMPDHGHGSDREAFVEWRDGANYSVENVVYTMPGLWTWTLLIETPQHTDSINWSVEIR